MSGEAEVIPIRPRPVLITATYAEEYREPLGAVAISTLPDLNYPAAFEDAREKLIRLAMIRYPQARMLTNFQMRRIDAELYHFHEATADVYGDVYDEG